MQIDKFYIELNELNILDSFPVVKKVFIKFNTSIPSSGPDERHFSMAIQILSPRRYRLYDKNFLYDFFLLEMFNAIKIV